MLSYTATLPLMMTSTTGYTLIFRFSTLFYPRSIYILVLCWLYQTLKYSLTKKTLLKIPGDAAIYCHAAADDDLFNWVHPHFWIHHTFLP